MVSEPPTGQLLIVVCALDGGSIGQAEALSRFPARPGARVRSYRSGSPLEDGRVVWECCESPEWRPLARSAGSMDDGLASVLDDALLAAGTDERPDSTEMVLLVSADGNGNGSAPHVGVAPAVERLRRRFRSLVSVSVVVMASFEAATRSASGRLVWLPAEDAAYLAPDGPDRVILLGDMDVRGIPMPTGDGAPGLTRTTELIAEGTFGELTRELLRAESGNRGHLGIRGRFVSLGFAQWKLSGEASKSAVAGHLAARMAAIIAVRPDDVPDPPIQMRDGGNAEPAGGPDWLGQAHRALWGGSGGDRAQGGSPEPWLAEIEAQQHEQLNRTFDDAGWDLYRLMEEAESRCGALRKLPNLAARELSDFMQRFAPWYARVALEGLPRREPREPILHSQTNLNVGRLLAILALLATTGLGGYGIYVTEILALDATYLLSALSSFSAGMYIAAKKGIHDTKVTTTLGDDPPPATDLRGDLKRHRNANWVANRLYIRSAEQLHRLRANVRELAEGLPSTSSVDGASEAVFDIMLESERLHPEAEVKRFWSSRENAVLTAATDPGGLRAALAAYAHERCEDFEKMDWNHLASRLMTETEASGRALLDRLLTGIHDAAAPRIVVEGIRSGTLLALPRDLRPEIREHICERLRRPITLETSDPGRLAVLRYTQGYDGSG
jgi:hypothetical protein